MFTEIIYCQSFLSFMYFEEAFKPFKPLEPPTLSLGLERGLVFKTLEQTKDFRELDIEAKNLKKG